MKIGIYLEGTPNMGGGFFQSLKSSLLISEIYEYKSKIELIITNDETQKYLKDYQFKKRLYKKNIFLKYYSKFFEIDIFKDFFDRLKIEHPFTKFLKSQNYDLIIFLGPSMMSSFCKEIAFVANIWDLDHKNNSQFPEHNSKFIFEDKEKLLKEITKRAFKIIVPHKSHKEDLIHDYKSKDDSIVVQNFIPLLPTIYQNKKLNDLEFEKIFNKFNLPTNKKIIFYPAKFWPHKNHKYIIDVAKILKDKANQKYHFVFCGTNLRNNDEIKHYRFIKSLISQKQLNDYITILNFLTDEEVITLYKKSNAVLMPTYCGPTNLPIYESFYFKKIIFYTKNLIPNDDINQRLIEIDITSPEDLFNKLDICFDINKIKKITDDNFEFFQSICDENNFKKNYKNIFDEFKYLLSRWK